MQRAKASVAIAAAALCWLSQAPAHRLADGVRILVFFSVDIEQRSETTSAPTDPLTLSAASAYYTPQPTPGKRPQCQLCLENYSVCFLIPKTDHDLFKQVWEKYFKPDKPDFNTTFFKVEIAIYPRRVYLRNAPRIEKKPSSMDIKFGLVASEYESEKNPEMCTGQKFPGTPIELLPWRRGSQS